MRFVDGGFDSSLLCISFSYMMFLVPNLVGTSHHSQLETTSAEFCIHAIDTKNDTDICNPIRTYVHCGE